MRSLMISLTILMFCFSGEVVNNVNDNYYLETNRTLLGWTSEPYITVSDLPTDVSTEEGFNSTLVSSTKPGQNFLDQLSGAVTTTLDAFTTTLQYLIGGITFIMNVLYKSSIGFHTYIQYMGQTVPDGADCTVDDCPIRWVPYDIAILLMVMVNINHMFAIYQIINKTDFRGGA